jgi:hypothetical protein
MRAEEYFFRYAFPCAQVLLDQKKIDGQTYSMLKDLYERGKAPGREVLESSFRSAFRRLKIVAAEMERDAWDCEVIRRYFLEQHNEFIDRREGDYARFPASFCELCKVSTGEVISRDGSALRVNVDGQQKKVVGIYLADAKPGDRVSVHLGFAIEILEM